jgi:hypothetical protein
MIERLTHLPAAVKLASSIRDFLPEAFYTISSQSNVLSESCDLALVTFESLYHPGFPHINFTYWYLAYNHG